MSLNEHNHENGFHMDCDRSACEFHIAKAKRNVCTKDDPRVNAWIRCSCDNCCRQAAAQWMSYMDRVYADQITLDEAQRLDNAEQYEKRKAR